MDIVKKNIINKRKKNIFNFNIFLAIFTIIIFICIFFNYNKIVNVSLNIVEKYSYKYHYNLTQIKISNLNFLQEEEILLFFDSYIGKSIFLIPIQKIANEIRKKKWVKDLNIKSNYKDTLVVNLQEELPLGIYDNSNYKILFSNNFVVLDILKNIKQYDDLIIFYGENSIKNSKKLLKYFKNDFKKNVKSATFLNNRRWNLQLKNQILLKLPEENINLAIENYDKIYENFSNNDLKDIESIDLRIKKKAIIKYKDKIND